MHRQGFSTKNIEYFERDFLDQIEGKIDASSLRINALDNLKLFHLKGMPKFWETDNIDFLNLVMENTVAGFYEGNIPIIFSAFGGESGLEIIYGTWGTDNPRSENNSKILYSSLESALHGLDIKEINENKIRENRANLPYTGLLTGTPSDLTLNMGKT